MTQPQLFQCLRFTDADRAISFLKALGFVERMTVRDPQDPSIVQHAQFGWRDNGGIMFGSNREGGVGPATGGGCCNIVVSCDAEVDSTLDRALAAGGTQINAVNEPPHGGRSVAVSDGEGNIWNIDSYPGA